jgi:hypothetical protein
MFTLSLQPTEAAQHWTDKGIAWLVAAFFSFGAMGCNFLGWTGRRREESDEVPDNAHETFWTSLKSQCDAKGISIPQGLPA